MAANENEYIKEAYNRLEIISQDEQKRMEYTARQKAVMDHNTLMEENLIRGRKQERDEMIAKMKRFGMSDEQIQQILNL